MNTHKQYDEYQYISKAFSFTAANYIQGISKIYGLDTVDSRKCRVLELGCSFGGNIISQALYNPESEYIGIDLSKVQIEKGQEYINKMGLKNIKLYHKNIMDIDESFGKFDYIIVHGVFSWVPNIVKEKILEIFKNNLSEKGIAFISYNVKPGWAISTVIRDIMLYTNKYVKDEKEEEKLRRSLSILKLIVEEIKKLEFLNERNKNFIEAAERVLGQAPHYVLHEYLEEFNDPMYFNEFIDLTLKYNLSYIGDTNISLSLSSLINYDMSSRIKEITLTDRIAKEQALDYILNTNFRRSLLKLSNEKTNINNDEQISISNFLGIYFEILDFDYENLSIEEDFKEFFRYFKKNKKKIFTYDDVKSFFLNENNEDNTKFKSFLAIILSLISRDNIKVYGSMKEIIKFEENITYIDEKYIKYIDVILNSSNGNIQVANYNNMYTVHSINLGKEDLLVMKLLSKPTTKKNIVDNINEYLKENNLSLLKGNEKITAEEFLEISLERLENLGYFTK